MQENQQPTSCKEKSNKTSDTESGKEKNIWIFEYFRFLMVIKLKWNFKWYGVDKKVS